MSLRWKGQGGVNTSSRSRRTRTYTNKQDESGISTCAPSSRKVGFKQSIIDECVFYKEDMIYVLYTNDSILAGPSEQIIRATIKQMQEVGLQLTIEGDLEDFFGVNIDRTSRGAIHLTQPHLIDSILQDLRLKKGESKYKDTPIKSLTILNKSKDSPEFEQSFNYQSVMGKMNYLEKGYRSELVYAIHQCARYSTDPRKEHGNAF